MSEVEASAPFETLPPLQPRLRSANSQPMCLSRYTGTLRPSLCLLIDFQIGDLYQAAHACSFRRMSWPDRTFQLGAEAGWVMGSPFIHWLSYSPHERWR